MSSITLANFEESLLRAAAGIVDEEHRRVILDYVYERRANGIKVSTLMSDVQALRDFANFLEKPFLEATRSDLNVYVNTRNGTRVFRSRCRDGTVTGTVAKKQIGDRTIVGPFTPARYPG